MYKKNGVVFPRVTDIIADSTPKNWGIQWGANCAVEWIKDNCDYGPYLLDLNEKPLYIVEVDTLDEIRFAHKEISKEARSVGSKTHGLIEQYLKDQLKGLHPSGYNLSTTIKNKQVQNAFNAFLKWVKDVNLKPITLEQTVWGNIKIPCDDCIGHDCKKCNGSGFILAGWAGTLDIDCLLNNERYIIDWKTSKGFYLSEMGAQIAAYRSCVPEAVGNSILRLDKFTGEYEWKDFSKRYESDLRVWNSMVSLYYSRHPMIRKRFE